MSDARTKAKNVDFPVVDPAPRAVTWLDGPSAAPVRKLFEPEEEPKPELPPSVPPPAAAPPPAAGPHQAAAPPAPPPAPPAPPALQPTTANAGALEPLLDERVLSQLPPPPKLGSLIPGARSAPPPANDAGYELMHEHAQAFANAAVELAIARASALSMLEGQLLDLSIEIASALIEREVEQQPDLHAALARAALSSLGDAERVTLRTSPEAYDKICHTLGGAEAHVRGVLVQVVSDASIPGLGCVVDGDNMRVDATVSERLRAVRRAFEEERRKVSENSE